MRLVLKVNLVLLAVFSLGLTSTAYVVHKLLRRGARDEVVQNARLLMEAALASRAYTTSHIQPLVRGRLDQEFLAESVPAFGATEQFNYVHSQFPDFAYKEATLNPTNLRDRASDWELDVINRFRQYPDERELVGERETPTGRSLYLAKPIVVADASCLGSHSTFDPAPAAMVRRYGSNGFGWKLHETVGAQLVSVPMALPTRWADKAFVTFISSIAAVFAVVIISLNVTLRWVVIRPVTKLAAVADAVSMGHIDGDDFPASGNDEVSLLAQSFNRMKKSLAHAIVMLEG